MLYSLPPHKTKQKLATNVVTSVVHACSPPFKPVPAAISSLHRSLLSCNMRLYRIGLQFIILARTGNGTKINISDQKNRPEGDVFLCPSLFKSRYTPPHIHQRKKAWYIALVMGGGGFIDYQ